MHLVSCKHPKRVFNKYIDDYVWVPCGECALCKNKKSAYYTSLLEREKEQHRYSFFVTLTYSEESIPRLVLTSFPYEVSQDSVFYGSRVDDSICIPYTDLFPQDEIDRWSVGAYCSLDGLSQDRFSKEYIYDYHSPDVDFFKSFMEYGGLPYASKTDVQKFLKRLNKYLFYHVTNKYKNFRYFIVSELGSTTFRPHFHAIFFVDSDRCAGRFSEALSACWKYGIIDCKPVESSACGYVAQYINKSLDMPYVYKNKQIRPFFLCSRNPFIGAWTECPEDDKELVNLSSPTVCLPENSSSVRFNVSPLSQSYQNRLFPKCPLYGSVSDNVRTQFYTIIGRFPSKTCKEFMNKIYDYMFGESKEELANFFRFKLKLSDSRSIIFGLDFRNPCYLFDKKSYEFLRRLYYFGRKVSRQACLFGMSLWAYTKHIIQYYINKELYILKEFYLLQEIESVDNVEQLALAYPQYLYDNNINVRSYIEELDCTSVSNYIKDAEYLSYSNKMTHFKNDYLASLEFKKSSIYLFNLLKAYYYGKECNEAIETLATSST